MFEEKIIHLIEQPLNNLGYELFRVVLIGNETIQVMIDSEKGIDINDCTKATRLINNILQVAEINDYGLEVSSPGMDRPLFKPAHYLKHLGQNIKVTTNQAIEDRKKFIGKLLSFNQEESNIEIEVEDKLFVINLNQIRSANLYYQPLTNSKNKQRK